GYDEISLTGPFKMISNSGEKLISPENMGFKKLDAQSIVGGDTIEESAKIFEKILRGEGTNSQNSVVIANSAAALVTARPGLDFPEAVSIAQESLLSGKALNVFNSLVNPKTTISFS
ncbi:MAG: anthranilate phosphoribosyltransferase, partial [Algoriphagus sp.]